MNIHFDPDGKSTFKYSKFGGQGVGNSKTPNKKPHAQKSPQKNSF